MATRASEQFGLAFKAFNLQNVIAGVGKLSASMLGLARNTATANNQLGTPFRNSASAVQGVTQLLGKLSASGAGLIGTALAIRSLNLSMAEFVRLSTEFNRTLETGQLGIASISLATRQYEDSLGRALPLEKAWGAANADAARQLQALRVAGLQTAATTRQLVGAFQEAAGVGSAYGLRLSQIRDLTVAITKASINLGLPLFQINQEIRALLSGDIDRNARVARALNITTEDVSNAQRTGKLFEFLIGKLQAFQFAGEKSLDTFTVKLSNLTEGMEVFAGVAGRGLFSRAKDAIDAATSGLFNLNTAGISEQFKSLSTVIETFLTFAGDTLLRTVTGMVKAIRGFGDEVATMLPSIRETLAAFGDLLAAAGNITVALGQAGLSIAGFLVQSGNVSGVFRVLASVINGTAAAIRGLTQDSIAFRAVFQVGFLAVTFGLFSRLTGILFGVTGIFTRLVNLLGRGAVVARVFSSALRTFAVSLNAGALTSGMAAIAGIIRTISTGAYVFATGLAAALPVIGAIIAGLLVIRSINAARNAQAQEEHRRQLQALQDARSRRTSVEALVFQIINLRESLNDVNLDERTRADIQRQLKRTTEELTAADKKWGDVIVANIDNLHDLRRALVEVQRFEVFGAAKQLAEAQLQLQELRRQGGEEARKEAQRDAQRTATSGAVVKGLVDPESEKAIDAAAKKFLGVKSAAQVTAQAIANQDEKVKSLVESYNQAVTSLNSLQETFSTTTPKVDDDGAALRSAKERLQIDVNEALETERRVKEQIQLEIDRIVTLFQAGTIDLAEAEKRQAEEITRGGREIIDAWSAIIESDVFKQVIKADPSKGSELRLQLADASNFIFRELRQLQARTGTEAQRLGKALLDGIVKGIEDTGTLEDRLKIIEVKVRAELADFSLVLRQSPNLKGVAEDIINAMFNQSVAQKRFEIFRQEIDTLENRTQKRVQEINELRESSSVTEVGARRRIAKVYQEETVELQKLVVMLQKEAAISGDKTGVTAKRLSEAEERLATVKRLAQQSARDIDDLTQAAREGFQTAFVDTILEIGGEIQKLDQFFKQFFRTIAEGVARTGLDLIAQHLQDLVFAPKESPDDLAAAGAEVAAGGAVVNVGAAALTSAAGALQLAMQTGAAAVLAAAAALAAAASTNLAVDVATTLAKVGFASGGYVRGPGSGTSDSIPARLSRGEYVINAYSTKFLGVELLEILNAAKTPAARRKVQERLPFASGGFVRGPGTGTSDSIPARLSRGEYVINAYSTRVLGIELLEMLNAAKSPRVKKRLEDRLPFATGGFVRGPGTATSDSIPARLSHGEYVVNAHATKVLGVDFLDAMNAMGRPKIRRHATKTKTKFADGGLVTGPGGRSGGEDVIRVELEQGLVLKELRTSSGRRLVVQHIKDDRKAVREIVNSGRRK